MTIKRSGIAEPISGNIYTKEIPSYCPRCEKAGIRNQDTILKPRLDYDKFDADQWRQCYNCGELVARHDIQQKGQLTTDVETITSKFTTQREGEHWEPPKHRRGFNDRLSKGEDEIKDPEVKMALKKGSKLISYSER